jgi:SAM-dependent methyltransferase
VPYPERVKTYEPREYWTEFAEEIGQRSGQNVVAGLDTPFYAYKRAKFLDTFLRAMPIAGKAVLEVGCGPGGNLAELAKLGPRRLAGCDISPAMLELAARNTAGAGEIAFAETDGKTLPFADREFDVTFTATVLQHNKDDALLNELLGEICRVTGETVYLFEDTSTQRRERYSAALRPVEDYARMCASRGFELEEAKPLPVYASERAAGALRRLLNRHALQAGDPISRVNTLAERAMLPPTKLLDSVIVRRRGLTRMIFKRRAQ